MNEISAENLNELEKRRRITAIVVSVQILTAIGLIIFGWFYAARSENAVSPNAVMLLWAMVIFIAAGTFVLRRVLFRRERLEKFKRQTGISGLLALLQTNHIILAALAEIIAVIGFLIAVLNGIKSDIFRAGAVALIVFLVNFPRKSVWQRIASSSEKV